MQPRSGICKLASVAWNSPWLLIFVSFSFLQLTPKLPDTPQGRPQQQHCHPSKDSEVSSPAIQITFITLTLRSLCGPSHSNTHRFPSTEHHTGRQNCSQAWVERVRSETVSVIFYIFIASIGWSPTCYFIVVSASFPHFWECI